MAPLFPLSNDHILFDIDGTLTDDRDRPQIQAHFTLGNAVFEIFRDLMVAAGESRVQAERSLAQYAKQHVYWDYADFIHQFNLPPADTWNRLREWHADHIRVYADGVDLVRQLHREGYPLHIISNNPLSGCLLKLEVAGLGGLQGTPFFSRIFCSNIQRGQKSSMAYWQRALVSADIRPEQAIVIGNDLHEDFEVPAQIGIDRCFIVDRHSRLALSAGPVLVDDLRNVEGLLRDLSRTEDVSCR